MGWTVDLVRRLPGTTLSAKSQREVQLERATLAVACVVAYLTTISAGLPLVFAYRLRVVLSTASGAL